jgi:hypothetical protein
MKFLPISVIIKLKIFKRFLFYKTDYKSWLQNGRPMPPPHLVKKELIKKYSIKYKTTIFIETGTYLGEMIYSQKNNFKSIYSIEIQPDLYKAAKRRFKNQKNVNILFGDSGEMLPEIVQNLCEKALFWLDGHYSGGITGKSNIECPIYKELSAIFGNKINHIIIIDDANCFNGEHDYPTIEELKHFIQLKARTYLFNIENNAIIMEKLDD